MSLDRTNKRGSPLGVWKTYGVDSVFANPFSNITIGNGTLAARWWTPGPVVAAFETPPFLVVICVALKFGSTTSVTGVISFGGPAGVDGTDLEIDPFLLQSDIGSPDDFQGAWPTQAQAFINGTPSGRQYPGFGVFPPDATAFVTVGDNPISGSLWNATTPDTWTEGSLLSVQRTFMGAFYGS